MKNVQQYQRKIKNQRLDLEDEGVISNLIKNG